MQGKVYSYIPLLNLLVFRKRCFRVVLIDCRNPIWFWVTKVILPCGRFEFLLDNVVNNTWTKNFHKNCIHYLVGILAAKELIFYYFWQLYRFKWYQLECMVYLSLNLSFSPSSIADAEDEYAETDGPSWIREDPHREIRESFGREETSRTSHVFAGE